MNITYISTTLLNNWPKCPKRTWESYDKRRDQGDDLEGTDATRFGTVVHNTLEYVHDAKMRDEPIPPSEYLDVWDKIWVTQNCFDFPRFHEGRQLMENFIERSMKDRFGKTISTELTFVLAIWPDGEYDVVVFPTEEDRETVRNVVENANELGAIVVVSKIDRIDAIYRADKLFKIEFFDYKSNFLPFTPDEVENSLQLGVYDLVVRKLYPDAEEYEGIFDMLRHGKFPFKSDDVSRASLVAFLRNLWGQISRTEQPEPRINQYCRWCEIRANCNAYQAVLTADVASVLTDRTDTPDEILKRYEEYESIGHKIKILEERRAEVKAIVQAKIVVDNDGAPLALGDREVFLSPNKRSNYDARFVFEAFKEAGCSTLLVPTMNISKTAMEKILKVKPEMRTKVQSAFAERDIAPTLKSRKAKELKPGEQHAQLETDSSGDQNE